MAQRPRVTSRANQINAASDDQSADLHALTPPFFGEHVPLAQDAAQRTQHNAPSQAAEAIEEPLGQQ